MDSAKAGAAAPAKAATATSAITVFLIISDVPFVEQPGNDPAPTNPQVTISRNPPLELQVNIPSVL
jgi:hypothetical protein